MSRQYIAIKEETLQKTGGTMEGAIAMGDNKITGLAEPTSDNDATNKTYVDTKYQTKILYGTTDPASTLGNDGDVYIKISS